MNSNETVKNQVDSSRSKGGRIISSGDGLTDAQKVFGGKDLLTERPKDMVFEDYLFLRKIQSKVLKGIFRKPSVRRIAQLMPQRLGYNWHPRFTAPAKEPNPKTGE